MRRRKEGAVGDPFTFETLNENREFAIQAQHKITYGFIQLDQQTKGAVLKFQKFLFLFMFLILIVPKWAFCEENLIGLYLDEEGLSAHKTTVSTYPYNCTTYLVVKNPTCGTGISAWECQVQLSSAVSCTGVQISGLAINFNTFPYFFVGLGEALPVQNTVTLCQLGLQFSGPGEVYLEKALIPSGDFGPYPVMVCDSGNGESELLAITPEFGGDGEPVFEVIRPVKPIDKDPKIPVRPIRQ